jgi:hypothetical protein
MVDIQKKPDASDEFNEQLRKPPFRISTLAISRNALTSFLILHGTGCARAWEPP